MKKLLNYVLSAVAFTVVFASASGAVRAEALTYGNNSENILNGGVLANAGSKTYYADEDRGGMLYVSSGSSSKKLSSDAAENINVTGGYVYYTAEKGNGSVVYRVKTSGSGRKELFAVSSPIEEMYADSEGTVYYLSGGKVYERASGAKKGTVVAKSGISHFIPTEHGVIAAKGSGRKYTIYADGVKIQSGVKSFYTYENYLIFTKKNNKDYQVKIRDLFENFQSSDIQPYTLGDDIDALMAFEEAMEDDHCDECEANSKNVSIVPGVDDEVDAVMASSKKITSALTDASEGQKNMVKRARQQHEIKWKPLKDITGWGGNYIFEEGTTYQGLPYGQPVNAAYVPWDASLEEFADAVADKSSKMYKKKSTYNKTAPYYSCDCSSFVSWSWDCASREWTRSIPGVCTVVKSQSIYSVQIGDAFCKPGSHVVMVSDIGYDKDDEIVYIDIMEQTPPSTKYTRWGKGGSKELKDLGDKYLKKGYTLYRYKDRDDVSFKASPAVSLGDDDEDEDEDDEDEQDASYAKGTLTLSQVKVELYPGESKKLTYTSTLNKSASWSSSDIDVATVSGGLVKAVGAGRALITLKVGSISTKAKVYVHPKQVKVKSISAAKDGSITLKWSKGKGVSGYEILRKDADGKYNPAGTTTKTKYTDTGLKLNSRYTYAVRAVVNLDGTAYYSKYDAAGVTARTVLATPELKSVEATSANSQTVSWGAVEGAEGYRVYGKSATKKKAKWKILGDTTDTSYTKKDLSAGSSYKYTVRAFFTVGGQAVLSNYEEGITAELVPPTPEMKSAAAYSSYIKVSWKKVKGAESYQVYRKKGSGNWKLVKTTSSTSFKDKTVTYNKKYRYTVRAIRDGVKSGYDKKGLLVKMAPGTPELVGAVSEEASKATVTWKKVTGVKGYYIYAKAEGASKWTKVGKAGKKATSFTQTGLESGKAVTYTVKAYWKQKSKVRKSGYDKAGVQVTVQ